MGDTYKTGFAVGDVVILNSDTPERCTPMTVVLLQAFPAIGIGLDPEYRWVECEWRNINMKVKRRRFDARTIKKL